MLSLSKETSTTTFHHAETKTSYQIKALPAKRYSHITDQHTKNGKVNVIAKMSALAVEIIQSWEGVGESVDGKDEPAECNVVTKAQFGEKFAFMIMPALVDAAMDFATLGEQEIDAAKKD